MPTTINKVDVKMIDRWMDLNTMTSKELASDFTQIPHPNNEAPPTCMYEKMISLEEITTLSSTTFRNPNFHTVPIFKTSFEIFPGVRS